MSFSFKKTYSNCGFNNPKGVAVSYDGDIYVSDTLNNRICKISNNVCTVIAGTSLSLFSEKEEDGMLAVKATLSNPMDLALSHDDKILYFTDSKANRVCKIENGKIYTIAKTESYTHGIAVSNDGIVYFSEPMVDKIYKIPKDGKVVEFSSIYSVRGLCFDSENGILYAVSNHTTVTLFYKSGGILKRISSYSDFKRPKSLAVSRCGDLYIADSFNHSISVYRPNPNFTTLKKFSRDESDGFTYPRFILKDIDPDLNNWIEKYNCNLSSNHREIAQCLIDNTIYGLHDHSWIEKYDPLDIIYVASWSKFNSKVKELTLNKIRSSIDDNDEKALVQALKKIEEWKELNSLLVNLLAYYLGTVPKLIEIYPDIMSIESIQQRLEDSLENSFFPSACSTLEYAPPGFIEKYYNNEVGSDITIDFDGKKNYFHKSILSSSSAYFEGLFRSEFNDIDSNNVLRIEATEFKLSFHIKMIEYCYGRLDSDQIKEEEIVEIFECSSFYGIDNLTKYCVNYLNIANFLHICNNPVVLSDSTCFEKLVKFGTRHAKVIFQDLESIQHIPEKLKDEIIHSYFKNL